MINIKNLKLKAARSSFDMSHQDLADKVGVSGQTINAIENDPLTPSRGFIKDNIEYDNLIFDEPDSKDFYDGLVELILDTVMSSKKRITIAGNDIPTEVVKSKLLKLDSEHIKYVEHCMDNTTTDIRNIKQYLLSVLYNAPTTMTSYYQAWVNRDNANAAGN